jgi:hypothetical protein
MIDMHIYKAVVNARGIAVVVVTLAASGATARADSDIVELENDTGFCLDMLDWSTEQGGDAIAWDCTHGENQQFKKEENDDGSFSLKNVHSGLCLDVEAGSDEDGANVIQWLCTGRSNQLWEEGDEYSIRSVDSGKCLDVKGREPEEWKAGSDVIQWECTGRKNQVWWIRNL